mmetsp:Transcript_11132/g.26758  ORF Transcript_11132/g.26758 Transcript_11132/m.26758 type:complete len:420 (+) Transcript_11132:45-1304(+)
MEQRLGFADNEVASYRRGYMPTSACGRMRGSLSPKVGARLLEELNDRDMEHRPQSSPASPRSARSKSPNIPPAGCRLKPFSRDQETVLVEAAEREKLMAEAAVLGSHLQLSPRLCSPSGQSATRRLSHTQSEPTSDSARQQVDGLAPRLAGVHDVLESHDQLKKQRLELRARDLKPNKQNRPISPEPDLCASTSDEEKLGEPRRVQKEAHPQFHELCRNSAQTSAEVSRDRAATSQTRRQKSGSPPRPITTPTAQDQLRKSGISDTQQDGELPILAPLLEDKRCRAQTPAPSSQRSMHAVSSTGSLRPIRNKALAASLSTAGCCCFAYSSPSTSKATVSTNSTGSCSYLQQLPPSVRRAACNAGVRPCTTRERDTKHIPKTRRAENSDIEGSSSGKVVQTREDVQTNCERSPTVRWDLA